MVHTHGRGWLGAPGGPGGLHAQAFDRLRWPGKQAVHGLIAGSGRHAPNPYGAVQLRQSSLFRFRRPPGPPGAPNLSNAAGDLYPAKNLPVDRKQGTKCLSFIQHSQFAIQHFHKFSLGDCEEGTGGSV